MTNPPNILASAALEFACDGATEICETLHRLTPGADTHETDWWVGDLCGSDYRLEFSPAGRLVLANEIDGEELWRIPASELTALSKRLAAPHATKFACDLAEVFSNSTGQVWPTRDKSLGIPADHDGRGFWRHQQTTIVEDWTADGSEICVILADSRESILNWLKFMKDVDPQLTFHLELAAAEGLGWKLESVLAAEYWAWQT